MKSNKVIPALHQPPGSDLLGMLVRGQPLEEVSPRSSKPRHLGEKKKISRSVASHEDPLQPQYDGAPCHLSYEGRPLSAVLYYEERSLFKEDYCGERFLPQEKYCEERSLLQVGPMILLIFSFFSLRPVGRLISGLPNGSPDGGCRNLRVRARKFQGVFRN